MGTHELQHLLHEYGCALVFAVVALQAAGAPLPGTTALIAAALYAATAHGLPIVGVIAAGALGALVGTSLGFALGRWRGEQVLSGAARRLRQPPERVHALRSEFARGGALWLFVGRFITGLRNITGLLAGSSGMAVARFLPLSAAAATLWAVVCSLEYYYFGHALANADTWLQIVLICAGIVWLVVGRFVTGLRNVTGLLAGASGMSLARFLPLCTAAATLWAIVCSLEYYFFGHALARADTWLQIVLVCAGIVWLLLSFNLLRRRALRRLEVPVD